MVRVLAALLPVALIVSLLLARRWTDWVPRGEIVQLTNARSFDGLPSLSPDGESVAYRSDAAGNGDILLSRIDGWKTVNLTAGSTDDETAPAFSPDGSLIAFSSPQSGIAVISTDGGTPRRLTREGSHPAWTPDGRSHRLRDGGHHAERFAQWHRRRMEGRRVLGCRPPSHGWRLSPTGRLSERRAHRLLGSHGRSEESPSRDKRASAHLDDAGDWRRAGSAHE